MVKVKPLDQIKKNYKAGATVAPTRYVDAVKTATWKDAAVSDAAESLYSTKMTEVISEKRRAKGIAKVSDADWRESAVSKGGARIGPGMTAAVEKQASHFAPFKSALEGVTLPDRTADPIANVDNRVKPIVTVLVAKKKELLG